MGDLAVEIAGKGRASGAAKPSAEAEKSFRARSGALEAKIQKKFSGDSSSDFFLDVSFAAPPGIMILFGPSGAGKTTVLDCIAGLATPDGGRIQVGGRLLFDAAQSFSLPVARRSIGYVFQDLALFPHLSVEANIQYGLKGLGRSARRELTRAILQSFRISHLGSRRPAEISGGERQRVALARALVTDPCLLLLDEPLAALDLPTQSKILEDLRAWNDAHRIPILYVTHSRREVFALGECVLVLEGGRIIAQGTPHDVLESPRQETVAQLAGLENIFDGVVMAAHERQGTMTCRLAESAVELEVPLSHAPTGHQVRVGIRAGDILLATAQPQGLSARNLIAGTVTALTEHDFMVVARVDCGVPMEVHLTPGARDSLELQPGRQVWLVIKTHSCHLLQ